MASSERYSVTADDLGISQTAYNIAQAIHHTLAGGRYTTDLQFQAPGFEDAMLRNIPTGASNSDITDGILAAMRYSSGALNASGNEEDNGVSTFPPPQAAIAPEVIGRLMALLPEQDTPYSDEQITQSMAFTRDVMAMPPILSNYQAQQLAEQGSPIIMGLMERNSFSEERAHAVLAATLAGVGGNVVVEDYSWVLSSRAEFVRDPAFIGPDNTVYLSAESRFGGMMYQMEQDAIREVLEKQGYTRFMEVEASFEGGSVIYDPHHNVLFIGQQTGQTQESLENAVAQLGEASGLETVGLKQNPDHSQLFHLDLYLSVLPNGEVLFFKDAVTPESQREVISRVGEDNIIYVSEQDAYSFATNLVAVGDVLVSANMSDALDAELTSRGYTVVEAEDRGLATTDWSLSKGGPDCLTQSNRTAVEQGARVPG